MGDESRRQRPVKLTSRVQAVPVEAYLAWAFKRLGTHRDLFAFPIEALTPAAFKKTLP